MATRAPKQEYVINPSIFRKMLITGGKMLEINRNTIDSLNVFPVPDGDTGTNMSLTMKSAIRDVYSTSTNTMEEIAKRLSSGALKGARGNSGVILSQIFKGLANGIATKPECDTRLFAKSLMNGVQIAYAAVAKPQEGTMLTVARVMAEHALEISKRNITMEDFLRKLLTTGEEILSKTPDMLPVLKRAGVVDSGGYGFVIIFKGFLMGYTGEEPVSAEEFIPAPVQAVETDTYIDYSALGDIEFAYCTEFFIINIYKKTTNVDIDKLREKLNAMGDSAVVVGDINLIKVHVHSNNPGLVLEYALELGELDNLKIENMKEQNRQVKAKYDAERKPVGLLSICTGDGFRNIFKDLLVDQVIEGGQTMNPSADDIAQAINRINAENVIVMPNNKNIILAAEQARALIVNKQVFVVPTKNIPQGLAATLSFNPEATIEDNLVNMNNAIPSVRTGSVTYAVRSTKVDRMSLREGDIIGLDGNRIIKKGNDVERVTLDLVDKMRTENDDILMIYYGKDVNENDAERFCSELKEKYPDWEIDLHYGGQPLYYYIFSLE